MVGFFWKQFITPGFHWRVANNPGNIKSCRPLQYNIYCQAWSEGKYFCQAWSEIKNKSFPYFESNLIKLNWCERWNWQFMEKKSPLFWIKINQIKLMLQMKLTPNLWRRSLPYFEGWARTELWRRNRRWPKQKFLKFNIF